MQATDHGAISAPSDDDRSDWVEFRKTPNAVYGWQASSLLYGLFYGGQAIGLLNPYPDGAISFAVAIAVGILIGLSAVLFPVIYFRRAAFRIGEGAFEWSPGFDPRRVVPFGHRMRMRVMRARDLTPYRIILVNDDTARAYHLAGFDGMDDLVRELEARGVLREEEPVANLTARGPLFRLLLVASLFIGVLAALIMIASVPMGLALGGAALLVMFGNVYMYRTQRRGELHTLVNGPLLVIVAGLVGAALFFSGLN